MKKLYKVIVAILLIATTFISNPFVKTNARVISLPTVSISAYVGDIIELQKQTKIDYNELDYDKNYYANRGLSSKYRSAGSIKNFVWEIADESIVSWKGKPSIEAKAAGKTKVYLKRKVDKSVVATFKITVKNKKSKLNIKNITAIKNQKFKLKLKNCKEKISWSSSNVNVAVVNESGKVTCKSDGECYISATVGSSTYKCSVKVIKDYDVSKLLEYIKENIGSSNYISKSSFYDAGKYIGDYTDYKYDDFFFDCLREVGMPVSAWSSSLKYIIDAKLVKEINKNEVKVGDFIVWKLEDVEDFYYQPQIVTKVDKNGFYVADLNGNNEYAVPSYFDYRPNRYNTSKKAWQTPQKLKAEMVCYRFKL